MSNDRFGMRWGYAGGTTLASIDEARAAGRFAAEAGFDSFWISHAKGVDPMMALACIADDIPELGEVGTSVTPLYGRHPIGLSQLVRTAQNALDGRFTLGVGASAKGHAEDTLGLSWDRPFSYTREFFDAMEPLLAGKPADVVGEQVSAHGELNIAAKPTPILLAALGPRMLKFAGARAAGTTLGQCGPKTIASYVKPMLDAAADAAGRPPPRIMALVRICVTDDKPAAKAFAQEVSAFYQSIPSYAAVIAKEGLDAPEDLHLTGSWQEILDTLAQYGEAGATDFRIEASCPDAKTREATREALADYL
jgi:F420-dependent oxidoreductase-like protein